MLFLSTQMVDGREQTVRKFSRLPISVSVHYYVYLTQRHSLTT